MNAPSTFSSRAGKATTPAGRYAIRRSPSGRRLYGGVYHASHQTQVSTPAAVAMSSAGRIQLRIVVDPVALGAFAWANHRIQLFKSQTRRRSDLAAKLCRRTHLSAPKLGPSLRSRGVCGSSRPRPAWRPSPAPTNAPAAAGAPATVNRPLGSSRPSSTVTKATGRCAFLWLTAGQNGGGSWNVLLRSAELRLLPSTVFQIEFLANARLICGPMKEPTHQAAEGMKRRASRLAAGRTAVAAGTSVVAGRTFQAGRAA